MNKRLEKQIFNNSLSLFLFIFAIEIVVKINSGNNIIDWSLLRIFISSTIISIIIGTILSLFKGLTKKIMSTILSTALLIYSWTQINLFIYLGFYMGTGNVEQGTKIIDYIKDFIKAAEWKTFLVLIPYILYLVYTLYLKEKLEEKKLSKTTYFIFKYPKKNHNLVVYLTIILIILGLSGSYYLTLKSKCMQNDLQAISNNKLFLTNDNSNLYVSQFGVNVYGGMDLLINALSIEVEEIDYEIDTNKVNKEINDNTRYIDDTAWNYIIENENNSTYNKLNNYFINRDITDKNEKTGIYEGKNLIVILMESINLISINEELYPNIYKIWKSGTSFVNAYSPRNNCATGNNEMIAMTSLYTINKTCTASKYKKNTYPEAIFNMFKNNGYTATSYHDYADHYYDRKTIHAGMGSTKYYNASALKIPFSSAYVEWPSDTYLIKNSLEHFINDDKFMVFMSTVTTHQPYSVSSKNGDKNLDKLKDYKYDKSVKRYMSKLFELDEALGMLLDELEKAGKAEDTVIALFADHYPYGLTTKNISEVLGYDVSKNGEVDRTPMVIYNPGQTPEVRNEYVTMLDLLPTLLNMFNIEHDPRLYFGADVYSETKNRVLYADGSWIDDLGYYSSKNNKFTPHDENNTYTNEEILNINKDFQIRQSMSTTAITNDYFKYLFEEIEKYNKNHPKEEPTTDVVIESEE